MFVLHGYQFSLHFYLSCLWLLSPFDWILCVIVLELLGSDSIDIIAGVVVNLVIHLVLYSSIDAVAAAATVIIHTADGIAVVEGGGGYCKTDGGNA